MIDSDFEGEIKVLTHSPKGISVVKTGQRPAQLILLPHVQTNKQIRLKEIREESLRLGPQCPELTLFLSGKSFSGLLDSGVDVSVTTTNQWPST